MPTVDDLFYKIGVLTIENDVLRNELHKVTRERDDLRAVVPEEEEDAIRKRVSDKEEED